MEDDVIKNVSRDANGRWLKGTPPPNPGGRPLSSRQKIGERLPSDLSEVWEAHGKTVLERLAVTEPATLARIAYGVLPKDILIGIENRLPGGLDPEDWNMLTRIVGVVRELAPTASGDQIEDALRSALAKPVVDVN